MPLIPFKAFSYQDIPTCLGRLRVRSHGAGEPIVFWSSLLMNGEMWLQQAYYFGKNHRVLLIDPPGHGDSQVLTGPFTFEQCAQCIVEVLDALGITRTHYVGNSWGGMIGGTFVAKYPERAGAAILMNCTASAAGLRHRIEFPLLSAIVRLMGGFRGPIVNNVVRAFTGVTSDKERPQVAEHIRNALKKCDKDSVAWAVESVVPRRPDQLALMRTIRTPVLIVAGEEDRTFAVKETLAMANAIPGAQSVVMSQTGHLAALECPDQVNRLIETFLAQRALSTAFEPATH